MVKHQENSEKLKAPKNYFTNNVEQLQWGGVPMYKVKHPFLRVLYFIYCFFMLGIFIYYYTFAEVWYALANVTDVDKLLFTLSYAVVHLMACVKITVVIVKSKDILRFLDKIEKDRFLPDLDRGGIQEIQLIKEAVKLTRTQIAVWAGIIAVMLSNRLIWTIRHPIIEVISPEDPNITIAMKQFPYTTDYIFHFDMQKSPYYELVYIHQVLSIWIFAWYMGNADTITNGLMIHLTAQFKIVANSFLTITDRAKRITEKQYKVKDTKEPKVVKTLYGSVIPVDDIQKYTGKFAENVEYCIKEAIQHHQDILDLAVDMEDTFNLVLLAQFLSSLTLYCFLLYQLSKLPLDPKSILLYQMCLFLLGMIFQLFIFCWNGDKMTEASESVAEAAYNSQWIPATRNVRMLMLLATVRAQQRPAYITAGKFSKLSMATFATILRGSVSYFMVLKNVNK